MKPGPSRTLRMGLGPWPKPQCSELLTGPKGVKFRSTGSCRGEWQLPDHLERRTDASLKVNTLSSFESQILVLDNFMRSQSPLNNLSHPPVALIESKLQLTPRHGIELQSECVARSGPWMSASLLR